MKIMIFYRANFRKIYKLSLQLSIILFMLFIINNKLFAQADFLKMDSINIQNAIVNLEKYPKKDTFRIKALISILNETRFRKEKEKVMVYYEEILQLSSFLNFKEGQVRCYFFKASYEKNCLRYENSLRYFDSVIISTKNEKVDVLKRVRANAFIEKAFIWKNQNNYYAALNAYFESLKYFENKSDKKTYDIYKFIAQIYQVLGNKPNYKLYSELQLSYANKIKDKNLIFDATSNIIGRFIEEKNYDSARIYLDKIEVLIDTNVAKTLVFNYYDKLGQINFLQNKFDMASTNFATALIYLEDGNHNDMQSYVMNHYALNEISRGNLAFAKKIIDTAFSKAKKNNSKTDIASSYNCYATFYNKIGNYKLANDYLQQQLVINDSIYTNENLELANSSAALFENEKKESAIHQLEVEKIQDSNKLKQKSTLNKILIGSAAALLFIGFLGYRNFRSRQKLQQAKITELEKDKQLLAIDAMLQGQEEERSRIAKDLHDGLGGMLSGTKLSFINMKENLVLTPENATQFDKSLSMLDNTIADLRKVAHNLMPEALVKFGLQEAVRDFCNSIQSSTYRIIQELVNNAVKHANATQIIVQLTTNNNKVGIAVEDNGKGFDANALANNKGAGMDNIKYRVQYFNGTIDTVTSAGNGTSVNIEFVV
jgi:two-component system, NarL family, sensor kinase